MKRYQIEILEAYLSIEEQAEENLRAAFLKALKNISQKIKMLQLSETMERLPQASVVSITSVAGEPIELRQQRSQVYQSQYQQEITEYIREPIKELEEDQKNIFLDAMKMYFLIGALSAVYELHKQNIPLLIPIKATAYSVSISNYTINFSGEQAALWCKFIQRDIKSLRSETISNIQRLIAQELTYNEISRRIGAEMNKENPFSTYQKAFRKALTIVRTEGGKLRNEAAYNTLLEAKKSGAEITKQWEAVLDSKTRDSHKSISGEIRELEEPFSNGLLYPCQQGSNASEVINCRCVALSRTEWTRSASELQKTREQAAFCGLDKASNFEDFKEKYMSFQ